MTDRRDPKISLRIAIFDSLRDRNRRYTHQEIAHVCGCSVALIHRTEQAALRKLRRHAQKLLQE